jgi:hypothetical protein
VREIYLLFLSLLTFLLSFLLGIIGEEVLNDLNILSNSISEEMKELNSLANTKLKKEDNLFNFQNSTILEPFGGFNLIFNSDDTNQYSGYETEVYLN